MTAVVLDLATGGVVYARKRLAQLEITHNKKDQQLSVTQLIMSCLKGIRSQSYWHVFKLLS